jgi:hypothetical protein
VKSIVISLAFVSACVLSLAGCAGNIDLGPDAVKGKPVSGTVEMQEVQAAYIGSGNAGTGVLTCRGRQYPFDVAGAGVGGIGLSTAQARERGDVYNLNEVAQFAGTYARPATALRSVLRAPATSGCRTRLA